MSRAELEMLVFLFSFIAIVAFATAAIEVAAKVIARRMGFEEEAERE